MLTFLIYYCGTHTTYANEEDQITWKIEPQFDEVWPSLYKEDIFRVYKGNKKGLINQKGEILLEPEYDRIQFPKSGYEGLILVGKDDKIGFINEQGEFVFEPQFLDAPIYSNFYIRPIKFNQKVYYVVQDPTKVTKNHNGYYTGHESLGIIDEQGNFIVPYEYQYISNFVDGLGILIDQEYNMKVFDLNTQQSQSLDTKQIQPRNIYQLRMIGDGFIKYRDYSNHKFGLMNIHGEVIVEPTYDVIYECYNGYCDVRLDEKKGVIDYKGKVIFEPRDWSVDCDQVPCIVDIDGLNGYINLNGEIIIEPQFLRAEHFDSNGYAEVTIDGENGKINTALINKKGEIVYLLDDFGDFTLVGKNKYSVEKGTIRQYAKIISLDGERDMVVAIESNFFESDEAKEKYALSPFYYLDRPSKYFFHNHDHHNHGYLDHEGNVVIAPQDGFHWAHEFTYESDLAPVGIQLKYGQNYGYIDKTGQWVIEPQFESASDFRDGMAVVKKNDQYGVINEKGEVIIDFQFDYLGSFVEGMAAFKVDTEQGQKYGFINTNGEKIIEAKYDRVSNFHDGLAWVDIAGKFGYVDQHGNEVIPISIETPTNVSGYTFLDGWYVFKDGYAIVQKDGKWGVLESPLLQPPMINNLNHAVFHR